MDFYVDGSRIKAGQSVSHEDYLKGIGVIIGWGSSTLDGTEIKSGARVGGSNINAEMFAIRDLLEVLCSSNEDRNRFMGNDKLITIITDSMTSLQIINTCYKLSNEEYMEGKKFEDLKMNEQTALRIKKAHFVLNQLGYKLKYKKVRGHGKDPKMTAEDVQGNANADLVATGAAHKLLKSYDFKESELDAAVQNYRENRFKLHFVS